MQYFVFAAVLLIGSGNAFIGKAVPRAMARSSLTMSTTTVPTEAALMAVS
jgi:hypothetical protein